MQSITLTKEQWDEIINLVDFAEEYSHDKSEAANLLRREIVK